MNTISISINTNVVNKNENNVNIGIIQKFVTLSIQNFCNKIIKRGFAWSAPQYQNFHRSKETFVKSNIIGIDIDNIDNSNFNILNDNFVKNNCLLLYTSWQHTKEKPRFRLIFKLPKFYSQNEIKELENIIKKLIIYFNADNSCSDCSRIFYGNTKAKIKVFDKILDITQIPEKQKNIEIIDFKITKNIENLLKNKTALDKMLFSIKNKLCDLVYQEWLYMCSSIWAVFSFEESIDILQKYYPEEKIDDYKYKFEHKLNTLPYSYLIKLSIKHGFDINQEIAQNSDFIRINKKGEYFISQASLYEYLNLQGFYSYFYNNNDKDFSFIYTDQNLLNETSIKRICEFTKNYIIRNYNRFDSEYLLNYLISKNLLNLNKLNFLDSITLDLHQDTKDMSYFYFKNGFLEINKDILNFKTSYDELKPLKLWKDSIRDFNFTEDSTQSEFEKFIIKICKEDNDRFNTLCCIIGYLLHRYKDPNINKCVVFIDEKINVENPTGRTGKTLISKALGFLRNYIQLDGKSFKYDDTFRFQNVELSTEIINIDDVPPNFNLKHFYSILTGTFKVERKKEKSIILPFEKSPKIVFTSNYTVDTGGGSDRARVIEFAFHNYYNDYFQPRHEFGHDFFTEWNAIEWNRFFTFCATCVQRYLEFGLLNISNLSNEMLTNKVRKQTNEQFAMWVSKYNFFSKEKDFYTQDELFIDFANFVQNDHEETLLTRHMLTKYLKTYFNICEIPFQKKCKRIPNGEPIWGYEISV